MAIGKLAGSSLWTEPRKSSVGRDERGHSGSLGPSRTPRNLINSKALFLATAGTITTCEKGMLSCSDAQAEPDECGATIIKMVQINPQAHQPTFLYQEELGAPSLLNCWSKLLYRANIKLTHLFLKLQS